MKQKNIQTTNVKSGGSCLTANKIHKKKAVQLLSRAILCSVLAGTILGVNNNTFAETQNNIHTELNPDNGSVVGTPEDVIINNSDASLTFDKSLVENKKSYDSKTDTYKDDPLYSSIYLNKQNASITADKLTFNGMIDAKKDGQLSPDSLNYFVSWQDGNSSLEINAKEISIGSAEKGDRGFQMKGANNQLTINADRIVSYIGDGFINAQGDGSRTSTAIINADYFEAHTTYGKDDYGVAILQANEGNTVTLNADTAILDGSRYEVGGVIGSGGYGTVNVKTKNLTIDGNICGTYGLLNNKGEKFSINLETDTLNMVGDINIGSLNNGYSNFSRNTIINITANKQAVIDGNINVKGNESNKNNDTDQSQLTLEFNSDSVITGDINVLGVAGKTGQDVSINLGGSGDMTGSKGVFNVENGGNVNFTGGKWAVKEWNSTSGNGNILIGDKASVIVNDNINVNTATTKSGSNIILNGDQFKDENNAAITATTYNVEKGTIVTVNNVNTKTTVTPFKDETANKNITVVSNNIMQDLEYDSTNNQFLVKTADASKVLAGGVLLNIAADITDNNRDIPFFKDVFNSSSNVNPVQSLNSLANIGELGGTAHGAYSMSNALSDSVHEHLSKPQHGDESDIWAKYIHTKENIDGVQLGGMTADIDAQYNGIIAGGEFYNKGKASAGMAFMYADGSISSGSGAYTKNDAEYYGASLYGRIDNGDSALIGDISYLHGSNDITQYNAGHTITASPDADAFSIGMRAEQVFDTNAGTFTPYAGLRYMHLGIGDYTDSVGLTYDADEQNLFLLPVGVKYSTEIKNGGWTIRPLAEAGYVWTLGDRDADQTVRLGSAADSFGFEVADSGSFLGKLGVEFDSDTASYGFGYEYQKGDTVKANRWMANMEFKF